MLSELRQLTRDQLRERQLQGLRWSLNRAWDRVPHYREAFEKEGVNPEDLRTLEDLRYFPLTTKDDLRRNYPFGLFAFTHGHEDDIRKLGIGIAFPAPFGNRQ